MDRVRAGEVFVAGGQPTVTYNPREQLALERRVREYLSERLKILSVSGPTKSGKTVLIRRVVVDRIWIPGGDIHTLEGFWQAVADELGVYTDEQVTSETSSTTGSSSSVAGGARPLGIGVSGKRDSMSADESRTSTSAARSRPVRLVAKDELLRSRPTIVIDDFHYIDSEVQAAIVRGLKDLVFEGVGVILASVPHRSYDAVRVETEMTGRVDQLQIPFWSDDELLTIPSEGFAALNVLDPDAALAKRLVKEAFSTPFLMQDFCLQLVKHNGVEETSTEPVTLAAPDPWDRFFRDRAAAGSKAAFDVLSKGPPRTDRKPRILRSGDTTDIYGAVLAAIADTGPLTELTYVELRRALGKVLRDDIPQQHEVTRVLEEMSKIARNKLEGEPVVDYDTELRKLHISDPYFAYYLRWAIRKY